eukprot:CAMPEP_0175841164 /NCGR_PEP_ID=MMETSP0107_2-20121207/19784_1 /TAXON_ID=195067 ORGANISM="Goniomonas pacifica, Strain CCMP1869" /NCGR_SAMPLE_ID=MMETSP0107_2 /ASSEMBLY_ACC=CAM_ASM_000203 /LENGTH=34 /DNA_ID= /DNA_START= /DNA_END= /DNA_ORIENTATION=
MRAVGTPREIVAHDRVPDAFGDMLDDRWQHVRVE